MLAGLAESRRGSRACLEVGAAGHHPPQLLSGERFFCRQAIPSSREQRCDDELQVEAWGPALLWKKTGCRSTVVQSERKRGKCLSRLTESRPRRVAPIALIEARLNTCRLAGVTSLDPPSFSCLDQSNRAWKSLHTLAGSAIEPRCCPTICQKGAAAPVRMN
jgi:hypothetical protein